MPDEVDFMDLAALLKMAPDMQLEKLGSALNSSIFDAGNIAGGLKQKALIEFTTNYPGPNVITVNDAGKALIAEAEAKSKSPFDKLDEALLGQLSGGKRKLMELQSTLNIRPKDLALRIYKLYRQDYLIYEVKNGTVELMLTERGFLSAKTAEPQKQHVAPVAGSTAQGAVENKQQAKQQVKAGPPAQEVVPKKKVNIWLIVIAIISIVIIAVLLLYLSGKLHNFNVLP